MSRSLDWMGSASCAGHPTPDIFFPSSTGKGALAQAREAELVCATCPVQLECAEHRTRTGASTGVWGRGYHTTKNQPRVIGFPHGTETGYKKHWQRNERPCLPCQRAHTRVTAERINRLSKTRPAISEKRCRDCGVVKPVDEFYRDNTLRDGFKSLCKPCHRVHRRQWAS